MKKGLFLLSITLLWAVLGNYLVAQEQDKKPLTLDLIFNSGELYPKTVRGLKSMNDGEHYSQVKKDSLNVYEYETGNLTSTIVTSAELIPEGDSLPISMRSYEFSADESKLLFATKTESIYRRSSKSEYYIFDLKSRKLTHLSKNGKQQLADFSPDGTKIAFVRDNNIFINDLITGDEIQVTSDGKPNEIINGSTDWVYEEEFSVTKGFHWSPDGRKIAFMRFDESQVKEWQIVTYGELYPEIHNYRYPKAGEANSVVTVHIYDLETKITLKIDTGAETDQYIPRIFWTKDMNTLAVIRENRLQNKLEILFANALSGVSKVIYMEENKYYIDESGFDNIRFLDDGVHFILTSEKSGFNHIYLYNTAGQQVHQVTNGDWDVIDLLGIDQEKRRIYYRAATVSPLEQNVYSVDYSGKNVKVLTPETGTSNASFSKNYRYFLKTWSDANTPPVYSINSGNDGKLIRTMQDNKDFIEKMKSYKTGKKEFFTIPTTSGTSLHAWKILPPEFDSQKKYPVMFDIYGGPGSQSVLNSYGGGDLWDQYLAGEGIIVVSVDGRGTGGRGEEFKKCTYLQLGKYETEDLIEAAKYMESMPYVDPSRTGIFGWSYGGYMSALCMTKGADYFDAGIAVAPVTNWRYYDNIYTERFMRTPRENSSGYDDNAPITHAGKLKGKFLMVHGMSDDNVHAQNAYDFATALIAANKDFEMMIYPNCDHGIYTGENTTYHLYSKMTRFLLENLVKK